MVASDTSSPGGGSGEDRAVFVDANVFLRYLTNDVPARAAAVEELFLRAAQGKVRLVTNAMVIAELVWVLESHYRLDRAGVLERTLAVAHMDGLALSDIDLLTDAMFLYESAKIDFIDAYNACWMKRHALRYAVTFDEKHFSRVDWVTVEPL